jgi:protease-4
VKFKTASAILRGKWLIQPEYVQAHLPLLAAMLEGQPVDFGMEKDQDVEPRGIVLSHASAGSAPMIFGVGFKTDLNKLPAGSIAVASITGPVTKFGDECSYGMMDHAALIASLGNNPNVAGVIVSIDSPGGEVSGTAALADIIKAVSSRKPVITMIDDGIAASAGMWIASAANEIYTSQKTDQVGSIGVYQTIADYAGYWESKGLKVREIYAPQSTDKNADYYEALKGNDQPIKEDLRVIADEFISTIKKNRGGKLTSDEWTTGKMFYTKDAIRIGLIDGMKSFDQVIKRMGTLIQQKQQSSSNNKAMYEKTLAAAKAENFEAQPEVGFILQNDHMENIEAALDANATAIGALEQQVETLTAGIGAKEQELATATATIAERDQAITAKDEEIAQLQAQVNKYGGKIANTEAPKENAEDPDQKEKSSIKDENNIFNKTAARLGL